MFQSFEKAWSSYIITLPNYPAMIQDVKTAILNYLCYKTLKICLLYREFGVLLGVREPIKENLKQMTWKLPHVILRILERIVLKK